MNMVFPDYVKDQIFLANRREGHKKEMETVLKDRERELLENGANLIFDYWVEQYGQKSAEYLKMSSDESWVTTVIDSVEFPDTFLKNALSQLDQDNRLKSKIPAKFSKFSSMDADLKRGGFLVSFKIGRRHSDAYWDEDEAYWEKHFVSDHHVHLDYLVFYDVNRPSNYSIEKFFCAYIGKEKIHQIVDDVFLALEKLRLDLVNGDVPISGDRMADGSVGLFDLSQLFLSVD